MNRASNISDEKPEMAERYICENLKGKCSIVLDAPQMVAMHHFLQEELLA